MWQILLGIYLAVGFLSGVLLWSALVLAKKSDRSTESPLQLSKDSNVGGEKDQRAKRVSRFLKVN